MKILNAIHAQTVGGVDQVFRDYAEVFESLGHEVALLISDNGHENYATKKIFKLKNSSQILDCFKLFWIMVKYAPDLVICHSGRVTKWIKILRIFRRFKSINVNHGTTFKHSKNCDYAISVNQQISDGLISYGFDAARSFVVPNAIRIDQKFREKTLKSPLVIGAFGRIEKAKGFDVMIHAAAILIKKGYQINLKIGGFEVAQSGYGFKDLQELARQCEISESVNFIGLVTDKKEFFSDVDLFCMPSREETFGLPIIESFLFSTPVISSDTDGGRFLIKDGEDGLLFENKNPEDLAKKIEYVLNNRKACQNMASKAFLKLEKDFSFGSLAQNLALILQKIFQTKC